MFLSTSGYSKHAFEGLTEIERNRVQSGDRTRIVSLVKNYIRADSGLWTPPDALPTLLFSEEREDDFPNAVGDVDIKSLSHYFSQLFRLVKYRTAAFSSSRLKKR